MDKLKKFYEEVKDKKIIIFGAGKFGKELPIILSLYDNIVCYIDNSEIVINNGVDLYDFHYNAYHPDELSKHISSETVVIISSLLYETEMFEQIKEVINRKSIQYFFLSSVKDIDFASLLTYKGELIYNNAEKSMLKKLLFSKMNYLFGYKTETKPFVFPRFQLTITTKCNLKCLHCRALIPLMKKTYHESLEDIKQQIDILTDAVDEIIVFEFIGGETFLYPYLFEALKYLLTKKNIMFIRLSTNCTVIPGDNICKTLSENPKVRVLLSDYGFIEKMSKLMAVFERYNISFTILKYSKWIDCGGIECRNRCEDELIKIFENCQTRECAGMVLCVSQFKLWVCPLGLRLTLLESGISLDTDFREITREMTAEEIRNKIESLYFLEYAKSCNYCDRSVIPQKLVAPAIQISGNLPRSNYTTIKRPEIDLGGDNI